MAEAARGLGKGQPRPRAAGGSYQVQQLVAEYDHHRDFLVNGYHQPNTRIQQATKTVKQWDEVWDKMADATGSTGTTRSYKL